MAIAKNNTLLKNHFKKHWQERVKVHFDQAGKKVARRIARAKKIAGVAPKPLDLLRPIVRAPTVKYNRKVRAGRGFTLAELKAASLNAAYARTIGIAVDHRRQNRSVEGFDINVQRLKDYKARLIVFPSKTSKAAKPNVSASESNLVNFPIAQIATDVEARAVKVPETAAYRTLRIARSDKKYKGIREKRAREKAEAEAEKKSKKK
ncbi:60S ribosomal protein eL13 [Ascoidea rubescens DSM 1968]|uniref:Ribosomal protein L13e n=1 Tax=Ascoidea rubescens DSM 1968 TaxID=1344418 RepID=A0A1D2VR20_9ASCO|nr:ribosomal protein L13e [Ascoidea rubescens DSM 1968]ODV64039.1 ribosomal protein L13e [Ascoidea rubescens DSM 1968]